MNSKEEKGTQRGTNRGDGKNRPGEKGEAVSSETQGAGRLQPKLRSPRRLLSKRKEGWRWVLGAGGTGSLRG